MQFIAAPSKHPVNCSQNPVFGVLKKKKTTKTTLCQSGKGNLGEIICELERGRTVLCQPIVPCPMVYLKSAFMTPKQETCVVTTCVIRVSPRSACRCAWAKNLPSSPSGTREVCGDFQHSYIGIKANFLLRESDKGSRVK